MGDAGCLKSEAIQTPGTGTKSSDNEAFLGGPTHMSHGVNANATRWTNCWRLCWSQVNDQYRPSLYLTSYSNIGPISETKTSNLLKIVALFNQKKKKKIGWTARYGFTIQSQAPCRTCPSGPTTAWKELQGAAFLHCNPPQPSDLAVTKRSPPVNVSMIV